MRPDIREFVDDIAGVMFPINYLASFSSVYYKLKLYDLKLDKQHTNSTCYSLSLSNPSGFFSLNICSKRNFILLDIFHVNYKSLSKFSVLKLSSKIYKLKSFK